MKKVVIYGAGHDGKLFLESYKSRLGLLEIYPIAAIVDKHNHGTMVSGFPVVAPDVLKELSFDVVIIASRKFYSEIKNELIVQYCLPENIIFYYATVLFSNMNLGDMKVEMEDDGICDFLECCQNNRLKLENDLEKFYFYGSHRLITKWMHYFEIYDQFFGKYRGKEVTVMEVGVFKGGSLQMWKHYFGEKAHIIGIDIDPGCKKYEEDHVDIRIGSQEDRCFWKQIVREFPNIDIFIDDGGHTMAQQIITLQEMFDYVADDGIYLCEDLHTSYMESHGGGYKKDTFIEHSKNLIDDMNAWYSEDARLSVNAYTKSIKAMHYYDSVLVIEKKKVGPALSLELERD